MFLIEDLTYCAIIVYSQGGNQVCIVKVYMTKLILYLLHQIFIFMYEIGKKFQIIFFFNGFET